VTVSHIPPHAGEVTVEVPPDAATGRPGKLPPVWRNPDFARLWLAQGLSHTVQNAVWFALWILVEERTHSTTQISIAIITSVLPSVLLGPLSGVVIDRMNKRTVLVWTMLLRIPTILGFMLYDVSLGLLYSTNFLFNAIGQFFAPAEGAKIPLLVRKEQLIDANSLFNITFTIGQFLGLVIIGPTLVKLAQPEAAFLLAAVVFAICLVLLWQLPAQEPPTPSLAARRKETVARDLWHEVVDGWRFVTQDRHTTLALAHLTLAAVLTLVMPALAPRFAVAVLDITAADAIWVLAPAGVGLFAGTSVVPALSKRRGKLRVIRFGLLVMALFLAVLAMVRGVADFLAGTLLLGAAEGVHHTLGVVPFVMVITFIVGFCMALVSVPAQTVLMERAPDEKRGRVLSTQFMLSNLISTVLLLALGGLADLTGINQVLAVLSTGVFVLWLLTLRLVRE